MCQHDGDEIVKKIKRERECEKLLEERSLGGCDVLYETGDESKEGEGLLNGELWSGMNWGVVEWDGVG